MRVENYSSYPFDIIKRVAVWSLSDLTQAELDLLADSVIRIENMPTDFDAFREEGIAFSANDTAYVYLRPAYSGHAWYSDVSEALVDVVRHEVEHLIIYAKVRAYFKSEHAAAADAAEAGVSSDAFKAAMAEATVAIENDTERLAKLEAIAAKVAAKFEAEDEEQAHAAGMARLDEWRELAPFEHDQVKFGKLKSSQGHWG